MLEDIYGGQMIIGEIDPIQVPLDRFYGIEVNDFAVEVAKKALWIAELQMLDQTRARRSWLVGRSKPIFSASSWALTSS